MSGFILLEQYAAHRTAATWTQALRAACAGLPITIVQGTADEATAQRVDIGAAISKATTTRIIPRTCSMYSMRSPRRPAWRQRAQPSRPITGSATAPGRPAAFAQRIRDALAALARATVARDQAQARRGEARALIRALGEAYHPYDLERAEAQPPERLATRLEGIWQQLAGIAQAADLPAQAQAHLTKARRLTTALLATVTFFFATVQQRVEALSLAPDIEQAVLEQLIPALYLERVAARSTRAEARMRLHALSTQILAPLLKPDHPIQALDIETRAHLEQVANDCADLFQRSSSAVEGRNGQLSLHHHGRHRLSDRKLAALTAVHNFHIRRADGTTAAERLFGRAPPPLFEQVLARVPLPPRPRRRRPRRSKVPYLTPLAA